MATNPNHTEPAGIIPQLAQPERMPPEQRREIVLSFMAEHGLALKPAAIHRNMRLHHRIPFTAATVQNILQELSAAGDLQRVDPSRLSDRELEPPADDGRGAYIITENGRERAQSLGR